MQFCLDEKVCTKNDGKFILNSYDKLSKTDFVNLKNNDVTQLLADLKILFFENQIITEDIKENNIPLTKYISSGSVLFQLNKIFQDNKEFTDYNPVEKAIIKVLFYN